MRGRRSRPCCPSSFPPSLRLFCFQFCSNIPSPLPLRPSPPSFSVPFHFHQSHPNNITHPPSSFPSSRSSPPPPHPIMIVSPAATTLLLIHCLALLLPLVAAVSPPAAAAGPVQHLQHRRHHSLAQISSEHDGEAPPSQTLCKALRRLASHLHSHRARPPARQALASRHPRHPRARGLWRHPHQADATRRPVVHPHAAAQHLPDKQQPKRTYVPVRATGHERRMQRPRLLSRHCGGRRAAERAHVPGKWACTCARSLPVPGCIDTC